MSASVTPDKQFLRTGSSHPYEFYLATTMQYFIQFRVTNRNSDDSDSPQLTNALASTQNLRHSFWATAQCLSEVRFINTRYKDFSITTKKNFIYSTYRKVLGQEVVKTF